MSREWPLSLENLISFCERVLPYTEGRTREQIESEAMRYDAVLRNIELIGEDGGGLAALGIVVSSQRPGQGVSARSRDRVPPT